MKQPAFGLAFFVPAGKGLLCSPIAGKPAPTKAGLHRPLLWGQPTKAGLHHPFLWEPACRRLAAQRPKILKKKKFSDDWQVFKPHCKEIYTEQPGFMGQACIL